MEWFISPFNRLAFDTLQHYVTEIAHPITLIYGPSGVGKTELLKNLYRQNKKPQVMLIDALNFSQSYAYAAQEGSLNDFRLRMRNLTLFILDNIETLKGKKHTLEELLHTVDALLNQGGKIVVSYQGEPQELTFLGKKLSSRLLGGMSLPILAPSISELAEYAYRYARSRYLIMPQEILYGIAIQSRSLREVQKHINDFVLYAENHAEALTKACWEDFQEEQKRRVELELSPDNILRKIFELTGVLPEEIRGNSREASIVASRKLAVYSVRKLCAWSYPQMGKYFDRAHSAMMKATHQFEEMMRKDPEWGRKFGTLKEYFD